MKAIPLIIAVVTVCSGCDSKKDSPAAKAPKNEVAPAAMQIRTALLAAPQEKKDNCTVLGYSPDKQLVVLKQGTNEMICLADNPDEPGFSVACYVRDLEPFMKRGRELRKQGIRDQMLVDEREKEVNAGTLQMPKHPAALYVY